jgi:hypothetical protein
MLSQRPIPASGDKRARSARSPAVVAAVKGGKQALESMTSICEMESCSGMKPE